MLDQADQRDEISIHALREESDTTEQTAPRRRQDFNPRSP